MQYDKPPETEFQKFIRSTKSGNIFLNVCFRDIESLIYLANYAVCDFFKEYAEMLGISTRKKSSESLLHDHRPLELNTDDYQRVCRIPKKKVFVDYLGFICRKMFPRFFVNNDYILLLGWMLQRFTWCSCAT